MVHKVVVRNTIRYPPFESSLMIPSRLPLLETEEVVAELEDEESAMKAAGQLPPGFKVGEKDSWYVSRSIWIETEDQKRLFEEHSRVRIDSGSPPLAVEKQRTGWYLRPHPIHRHARRVVTFAVALLLIGLLFQTLEPILVAIGILPGAVLGGVRFGLLDYPFLVVYIGPLMLVPYLLRVWANVKDLKRQKEFLNNPPASPEILFLGPVVADSNLDCRVRFDEPSEDWTGLRLWWQVGVLPPPREEVMQQLGREEDSQPPPGLSTALPHYWEEGLSDGGGFGEDTPLMEFDAPGGLFLRPLRMMEWGGRDILPVEGGEISLAPPSPDWPGTNNDRLAPIHWELVIRIDRQRHGPLYWVHPLRVAHGKEDSRVSSVHINDGRIEDSIRFEDDTHPMAA